MFSLQKNLDLKAAVQKTFPKRKEIFVIGKDQLGSFREKSLRTTLPFLAFLIPIIFLFADTSTREALLDSESTATVFFTLLMIILSFIITLTISVYMFAKWYTKIETYYLDTDSLQHEVIFRGKIKLQTYDLDNIDFIYFERRTTSTGSSSSSTTSYYVKVHNKTASGTDKKPGLLFKADKRRLSMIIEFLLILQNNDFRVEIQRGFKSHLVKEGKWKDDLEEKKPKVRICSNCNTSNKIEATFCEVCGDALKTEE